MTASEPVQLHHPWTVADLERIPDDPNRYEIFHGSLLVTPPAFNRHNTTLTASAERLSVKRRTSSGSAPKASASIFATCRRTVASMSPTSS